MFCWSDLMPLLSDGWFYEGAGIYRHVWLTKTAPVHVKKWGTLATAKVQPSQATVTIRTEIEEPIRTTRLTCASSRLFSIPPTKKSGNRPVRTFTVTRVGRAQPMNNK